MRHISLILPLLIPYRHAPSHVPVTPTYRAELASAPSSFNTIKAKGSGLGEFNYRIQVSRWHAAGDRGELHAMRSLQTIAYLNTCPPQYQTALTSLFPDPWRF